MLFKAMISSVTIGAAIMALPASVQAHGFAASPDPEPNSQGALADGHYELIEQVVPQVWLIRQKEPFQLQPVGNVTVIEQADGVVLVDAGGSPGSGRRIAAMVQSVTAKPVKAVIITHWHDDHVLGLSEIRAIWPDLRIIAHERTAFHLSGAAMSRYPQGAPDPAFDQTLEEQSDQGFAFLDRQLADPAITAQERRGFERTRDAHATLRSDLAGVFLVLPTETFDRQLVIDDPDVPVTFLHFGRANTDGDAIAWLPRQRIVVTGDIVVAPVPFGFESHAGEWITTLDHIRALPFSLLIPGHGHAQAGSAYIDNLQAMLAAMRAQVASLAAEGLEPGEIGAHLDLAHHKSLFTGDDPWLDRWFDQYWVRPMVAAIRSEGDTSDQ